MQVPVGVDGAEVAGAEEVVGRELRRRQLGAAPVPREHVRPPYLDKTDRSDGAGLAARRVGDSYVDAGQGATHRTRTALAVQWVRRDHRRLRHAVALEDLVTRPH